MVYMPYDKYKKWKEANATEDKFEVEFFKTDNGNKPAKEFLDSLDKKMRSKMLWLLSILEENGNELREPYSKYIGDHIFELRAKVGTDITRMLYFFYHNGRIIVTNGFVKKRRAKMSELRDYINEQLKDPEFKKEWDNLEPEMEVVRAMIKARTAQNLTQKDLAEKTGINQANISKLENGNMNPSLKLLKRLADGLGMNLRIEFVPKNSKAI